MKLVHFPDSYAPIAGGEPYLFEELNPSSPEEVKFYTADGTLLGTRRYYGRERVECSPKAYLRRLLHPEPHLPTKSGFAHPESREVGLYLRYGESLTKTPTTFFSASCHHHSSLAPLGEAAESRKIACGEFDEVAMLVPSGVMLKARCSFPEVAGGGEVEFASLGTHTSGVWILSVVVSELVALAQHPESVEKMSISVYADGQLLRTVDYTVDSAPMAGVRLAWVDEYGAIGYHTFEQRADSELATSRVIAEGEGGAETISVEGWLTWRVESGLLSSSQVERLSQAVLSPSLWLITESGLIPVVADSARTLLSGKEARSLSLTLRTAQRSSRL